MTTKSTLHSQPSALQRKTNRRRWAASAALGTMLLVATGCGQDASSQALATVAAAAADQPAEQSTEQSTEPSSEQFGLDGDANAKKDFSPGAPGRDRPGPAEIRREVIYTATANVEVTNATTTANALRKSVIAQGGYVLQDERSEGSARMILRMKPDNFDAALAGLAKAGKVRSQNVTASDVTADMVDLEARLKSATISRDRLRALLNGAVKVQDIIQLEAELSTREATVEQLQGQLNVIRNQVGFATINVSLFERSVAVVTDTNTTPSEGFQKGWVALRNFGHGLLVFLATIAVWLPLLVLTVFAVRWYARRWRKKHPTRPTATWTPNTPTWTPNAPNAVATAASAVAVETDTVQANEAEATTGS
jgi:hypothetical protein